MNQQITMRTGDRDRLLLPFQSKTAAIRDHLQALETGFSAAIGMSRRIAGFRASIDASENTPKGVNSKVQRFERQTLLPEIASGHVALRRAQARIKNAWAQLKPKAIDKTDFVALRMRECFIDKLQAAHSTQQRRDEYLKRAEIDPEQALAIVEEMATDLPGTLADDRFVSEQTLAMLTRKLVMVDHADAVAEIEELQSAVDHAQETILKAGLELQHDLAMAAPQFETAVLAEAEKIEKSKPKPDLIVLPKVPPARQESPPPPEEEAARDAERAAEYEKTYGPIWAQMEALVKGRG